LNDSLLVFSKLSSLEAAAAVTTAYMAYTTYRVASAVESAAGGGGGGGGGGVSSRLCVSVGEPLQPAAKQIPLNSFIDYYSGFGYNITLISNTTVVVHSAGGVGSTSLHTVEFPITPCN
jgi:hypothetical protein